MTKKLDELLLKARDLIATGKLNDADEILNPLKDEYPLSQDVARLWCSLAMQTDRTIDVHISALRRKLQDDPKNPRFIRTVRAAGYMLIDQTDRERP